MRFPCVWNWMRALEGLQSRQSKTPTGTSRPANLKVWRKLFLLLLFKITMAAD
jgi:hypothetical protein